MRIITATLFFTALSVTAHSQSGQSNRKTENEKANIENVTYRLFPTENMWTFIKLNTRNGQMWQIQYDVEGNNRGASDLYVIPLVTPENEMNGRFTLYSTQNIHTFILLDQVNGKIWQVQWSTEIMSRIVVPID
jgi:hypothetical protein